MKCPKCQTENPDERKFCHECGAKLLLICPQCGSEDLPSDKFCGKCGHNLTLPSEPPPRPPSKDLSFDEKLDKIQRYLPKGLTEKILSQRDKIEGERKQVTVMFCDMVGFTALSERLDPEDAYSTMDQILEILIHKVHDYEGTVNKMTGDGIMALFGAPIALEDGPQRAIRSALAIHREISGFSNKTKQQGEETPSLKMRIGIHTGPVVVGTIGNNLRVEFTAVGDTVNLASRMEGLAEPRSTYVTEETFRLTEGLFRFEALGEKKVKGKEEPVKVYRVIAPSTRRTRFDVSAERGLTAFVGRERELELVLDGFERSKTGRGQAFSIMAEAGVGKSRLLYEFRKAMAGEDATFLEGKCLSYSRGVAYHPVTDSLKSNFDIQEGDGDSEIREKVKKGLKVMEADEASTLPYLLELLSVKDSGIDKIPMSPEAKKDRIIKALNWIALKGSEIRPLIMAIEDLHWVDKSSEESFKDLLDSISGARVFLIFTYRPEFVHTWGRRSYHSQVTLNRLSNRESLAMVTHLLGTEDIDRDLEELILEKTEGVPFFIEEFIKSLKDLKIIEKTDNRYHLTEDIRDVTIPSTIQDIIMASVDCLPGEAKEVLQKGSVIEREFSHELIKRVVDLPEPELLSYLSVLKDAELLYERGIYPESIYIFKHAVTREVVYDSILTKRKKSLHEKIAQAIEEVYAERLEEFYGMLAYHYELAEIRERAIHYLTRAADRAKAIYANEEAIAFYRKAIEQVTQLLQGKEGLSEEWRQTITQLHESLGDMLELTGQHEEARSAYQEALAQIPKHDVIWQSRLHRKTGKTWEVQSYHKKVSQAYDLAESTLGREPDGSPLNWWQEWIEIQIERLWLLYWQNQLHKMTELAEKVRLAVEQYGMPTQRANYFNALALMDYRRDRYLISEETVAHSLSAVSASQESDNLSVISVSQFLLGFSYLWGDYLDEAEEPMQAALTLTEQTGDVVLQSRCLTYLTILYRRRAQIEKVRHYVPQCLESATVAQMPEYIGTAKANLAWVAWREGNLSETEANGRAALESWQQVPASHASCAFQWTALCQLIGVALAQNQISTAIEYARALLDPKQKRLPDALTAVLESAIKTWEEGETETTNTYLNQAIELAQKLNYL